MVQVPCAPAISIEVLQTEAVVYTALEIIDLRRAATLRAGKRIHITSDGTAAALLNSARTLQIMAIY